MYMYNNTPLTLYLPVTPNTRLFLFPTKAYEENYNVKSAVFAQQNLSLNILYFLVLVPYKIYIKSLDKN